MKINNKNNKLVYILFVIKIIKKFILMKMIVKEKVKYKVKIIDININI